jgi:hypothetical protein
MKSAGGVREAPDLTSAGTKWSAGDRRLRSFFRQLNRFMLWMWRVGLGRWINAWPAVGGRIMVVTHRGRRSGRLYRTPLNYAPSGRRSTAPLVSGPAATGIELIATPQGGVARALVRIAGRGNLDDRAPARQVLIASGFAAYLAGINPRRVKDEELERRAHGYRLVRIRPIGS